jgi:hypothetical protein
MKDFTPVLWIAGLGILAYYGYTQGWFGNTTVSGPGAIPPVSPPVSSPSIPIASGGGANLVPVGVLTPIEPTPVIPAPVVNPVPVPPVAIASPIFGGGGNPVYVSALSTGGGCVGCM